MQHTQVLPLFNPSHLHPTPPLVQELLDVRRSLVQLYLTVLPEASALVTDLLGSTWAPGTMLLGSLLGLVCTSVCSAQYALHAQCMLGCKRGLQCMRCPVLLCCTFSGAVLPRHSARTHPTILLVCSCLAQSRRRSTMSRRQRVQAPRTMTGVWRREVAPTTPLRPVSQGVRGGGRPCRLPLTPCTHPRTLTQSQALQGRFSHSVQQPLGSCCVRPAQALASRRFWGAPLFGEGRGPT